MVESGLFSDSLTMTTAAETPTPEPPVTKRLTRSTSDRVIAGVAGGLGRYFGVDAVVMRLAFVVLIFFGGAGLILYGAAWILVPSDDKVGEGFDTGGVVRRTGIALGIVVLTFIAAVGGFWGFAIGGGTATAIVVIVVGVALAVAAFTGGARWLILPAIALALSAGVAAAADIDVRGGAGERIYAPASAADLRGEYRLGIGHLRVDLRNSHLGPGDHRIHLKLGVGQAEVLVPSQMCVSSKAHVAAGATTIFERETGGVDHDWQEIRQAPAGRPHLIVDGDIGIGQLRIEPGPEPAVGVNAGCIGG
jgi:phage shock protein PspC (stress-responsive transcriptional regulator)